MKFAVVGSRTITDYKIVKNILDEHNISTIISGGAKGIDQLAERYANEKNLEKIIYLAKWDEFGRGAGMVRNTEIIKDADEVVAIWDGTSKGTENSINLAKKLNKPLYLYTVKDEQILKPCIKNHNNAIDALF